MAKAYYTKRFRITKHNGIETNVVARFASIEECVAWANDNSGPFGWENYTHYIEDMEEDVEIEIEDLMHAWGMGERPLDLSMF